MKNKVNNIVRVIVALLSIYGIIALVGQVSYARPALAAAAATATPASTKDPTLPTPRPGSALANGLFVNLSSDDIDTAAMAIGFATKVLTGTEKPVTIFMNVDGVRLVDIHIPPHVHSSGKTIHQMLQMFMDEGGVALVCPTCMVNVGGMTKEDVLPGVLIGTPDYTWAAMFAENVTVLSY